MRDRPRRGPPSGPRIRPAPEGVVIHEGCLSCISPAISGAAILGLLGGSPTNGRAWTAPHRLGTSWVMRTYELQVVSLPARIASYLFTASHSISQLKQLPPCSPLSHPEMTHASVPYPLTFFNSRYAYLPLRDLDAVRAGITVPLTNTHEMS
ncbi:hypothetical protein GGR56DRAFT_245728 [Xylariaceae sp. FL0804]|nr:hypothetical protein GGR56DRAFT_245728 [Xylariaceae sp. FL0804]